MAHRLLRLTLFTRPNCSLCTDAKSVLSRVWEHRRFHFKEIEIMKPENYKIWSCYEFDTPVLHVEAPVGEERDGEGVTTREVKKLMHRFKAEEVLGVMERVDRG